MIRENPTMWTKTTRIIGLGLLLLLLALMLSQEALAARSAGGMATGSASARVKAEISLGVAQQRAIIDVELCAKPGTMTMPDSAVIDIWGYALKPAGTPCTDSTVVASLPGPVIEATAGDTINITVYNELGQDTSVIFPGQPMVPDVTGFGSGSSYTYTLVDVAPGSYLYESGLNAQKQIPMGLYGALIVHSQTAGQAYDTAASAYDRAETLLLSEIDPALNADPAGFNMLNYAPKYWLINGKAYPDTVTLASAPGERLLIRYLNAGAIHESMSLLGLYQTVVGADSFAVNFPYDLMVPNIPSGETLDVVVAVPADITGARFPLYNRHMALANVDSYPGGMMTFLELQAP